MQDLAWNMMGVIVVLALAMGLFASVSWAESVASEGPTSTTDEASDAMGAFQTMMQNKRPRQDA